MSLEIKKQVFEIIDENDTKNIQGRLFNIFIMAFIFINTVAIILETVENISVQYAYFLWIFEIISVAIFTIEYILRLWTCNINDKFKNSVKGRIKFAITPFALIDLIAILPFYLVFIPFDLRFIRALRLIRLFRLLKIGRYSKALKTFGIVFKEKKEELCITIFSVSIILIVASSMMYIVENEAQPDVFSSIPASMWWGVITLTTVGYGDVYPITTIGKLLGGIIALLGVGMVALPAGILASGFADIIQKTKEDEIICPHCDRNVNEPKKY